MIMRLWILVTTAFMPYIVFVLVTLFCGFILETQAFHEYPSPKRLKKEEQKCKKILEELPSQCEKRLEHCCKPGKNSQKKPVCATNTYGFGMVFYNPCSMHYIRCMYPTVCFLKRSMDNPHCARYQVMRQDKPFDLPCGAATTMSSRTKFYQGEPNSPMRTPNPDENRYKSPLYDIRTSQTPRINSTEATITQFLPVTTPSSHFQNRTTTSPVEYTTKSFDKRTTGFVTTTATTTARLTTMTTAETTTAVSCADTEYSDFTYTVSIRDAKFRMEQLNMLHGRTSNLNYDGRPERIANTKCTSPPPSFPLCNFPRFPVQRYT